MRDKLGFTYPQIARIMGRNHASVWQGCRKMRELVQQSPAVADMVERAWAIVIEIANKDGDCDMSELRRLVQQNDVLKTQRDKILTALVGVMRNVAVTDVEFDPQWGDGFLKAGGNVRVQRNDRNMRVSFEFPCSKIAPMVESRSVEFDAVGGEDPLNLAVVEGE
jgi:tellurite resistance protein